MTAALAAVQVRLELTDLESPEAFRASMDYHAQWAAERCGGAKQRLFVFPENLGHFAMLAFAPKAARNRATVDGAVGLLAASRPWSLARAMLSHGTLSLKRGALLALAPQGEQLMHETFGRISKRHGATVVAGSFLRVRHDGQLHNSSCTYDADGRRCAVTDKVNLVPGAEDASPTGLGLARGNPDGVALVDTGFGKLATLICYDGFCEPHTQNERFATMGKRIDRAGGDIIANPAANPWPWNEAWHFAEPGENILRKDQWRTEGLPATLATLDHVRYGVTAHLAGQILDQSFEGRSEILERGSDGVKVLAEAKTIDTSEVVVAMVAGVG